MLRGILRPAALGATCAISGLVVGAKEHSQVNSMLQRIEPLIVGRPDVSVLDRTDAKALMGKAVELAAGAPASSGILATNRKHDAPAMRLLLLKTPFGVQCDGNDVSVLFNTNRHSRKVAEMCSDPHATLLYWDPEKLAYVSFSGRVEQLRADEASHFFTPFLRLFYPEGSDQKDGSSYTAWRLRASSVQLVAIPGVESTRHDWRPVELVQPKPAAEWVVACDGK